MKRYCFIYNPGARRGHSKAKIERLKAYVSEWEGSEIFNSTCYDDLSKMSEDASGHFDIIVACGGDGTVREVASGLIHKDTPMGIIPMGSGNDFSKSLGIPRSLPASIDTLTAGNARPVDMGSCNDFYFINTLGFGFDGLTNRFASRTKYINGTLKYIWSALKANYRISPFTVRIQTEAGNTTGDGEEELLMISAANGRVEGGRFYIAPEAKIDDGTFSLVTVRPISKFILPVLLPLFWFGKQKILRKYASREVTRCKLEFDQPQPLHADGEIMQSGETVFDIEVIPGAVQVIGSV